MRATWTAFLTVLATLVFAPAATAACDHSPTPAQEFAEADYVFIAQVTAARMNRTPDDPEGFDGVEYTVHALKTFKGEPPEDLLLYSENTAGRFPMMVTGWYLVFVGPASKVGFSEPPRIERRIDYCGNSFALNTVPRALEPYPSDMTFDQVMAFAPPINELVERADGCVHFAGEEPYDEVPRAQIEAAMTDLRCDVLQDDVARERARNTGVPAAQARLDRALQDGSTP